MLWPDSFELAVDGNLSELTLEQASRAIQEGEHLGGGLDPGKTFTLSTDGLLGTNSEVVVEHQLLGKLRLSVLDFRRQNGILVLVKSLLQVQQIALVYA